MWAYLPSDLIIAVAKRLPAADFARFRAVCRSWALSVKDLRPHARTWFPWLYLTMSFGADCRVSFFDGPEDRYYRLPLAANILAASKSGPIQLRDGLMAFILDNHLPVIFNPISGTQLSSLVPHSPKRSCFSYTIIPCQARKVVFLLHGYPFCTGLAYAGPGDERWACVPSSRDSEFTDVVYHQGKFYALYDSGEVLAFDIGSTPTTSSTLARNKYNFVTVPYNYSSTGVTYLASSSSGDLLHVRMIVYNTETGMPVIRVSESGAVNDFVVMKLDENADGWVEIKNLGGSCMFLDRWQVMLIPPQDVPAGVSANCIYYAGHHYGCEIDSVADVRVYEMGTAAAVNPASRLPENFRFDCSIYWFRPSFA